MGRPVRAAKPKILPPATAAGPKKAAPPKPPVTSSKAKNLPAPPGVTTVEPEDNTTAPEDAECDMDELAALPTDSKPEVVESEPGEENDQTEEQ